LVIPGSGLFRRLQEQQEAICVEGLKRAYLSPPGPRRASCPASELCSRGAFSAQRDPEHNGVLACGELGIGFVPWGPVGQGFLTAKIDSRIRFDPKTDMRSGFPRFTAEAITANQPVIDLFRQLASRGRQIYREIEGLRIAVGLHRLGGHIVGTPRNMHDVIQTRSSRLRSP
jgi:hypothetical protein